MRLKFDKEHYSRVYNALVTELKFPQDIFLTDDCIEIDEAEYKTVCSKVPFVKFTDIEAEEVFVPLSPKMFVTKHCSANKNKVIEKINKELADFAKKPHFDWVEVIIDGDYSTTLRNEVAKEYVKTGWDKVYHHTSSENGEKPGLTSFVFLTKETIEHWEKCHSTHKYWHVSKADIK